MGLNVDYFSEIRAVSLNGSAVSAIRKRPESLDLGLKPPKPRERRMNIRLHSKQNDEASAAATLAGSELTFFRLSEVDGVVCGRRVQFEHCRILKWANHVLRGHLGTVFLRFVISG